MKKIISMVLVCVLLVGSMLALVSCSNISESYAEKINKAAEAKEYITYSQVKEDLGEDIVDLTATILGSTNGVIIAVKGCANLDELEDKLDNGEKVEGIVVTILNSNATKAVYKEISEEDF